MFAPAPAPNAGPDTLAVVFVPPAVVTAARARMRPSCTVTAALCVERPFAQDAVVVPSV
jgi:hypothetical protein